MSMRYRPTSHYASEQNSLDRLADASGVEDDGLGFMRLSSFGESSITPKQVRDTRAEYSDLAESRTAEFEATLPEGWKKGDRAEDYKVPAEGHLSPHIRGSASSEPAEKNPFVNPNTGEPAEHVYRWEGKDAVEAMESTGSLKSTFGGSQEGYTHVSLYPSSAYKDADRRLLQIKANQPGHVNRVKERGYGVISGAIPKEHVTDVTDTYEGPSYESAPKYDTVESPMDWYETPEINRAYDMRSVAAADAANEATKQIEEGVMKPSRGAEFWRGIR